MESQQINFKKLTKQELEILAAPDGRKFGRNLRYRAAQEILQSRQTMSAMVKEFNEKQDIPKGRLHQFQLDKMGEEYAEVREAITHGDKQNIAHEIADLIYTLVGIAVAYEIKIEPVFAEVHRCNMLKGPGFDKTNYTKPEIKI